MKNRPEPVRRICLWSLLSIPLFMLMAAAFWAFGAAGDAVALQVMGAVIFALAVAQVVVTWGFWNLKRWAYHAMRFSITRGSGIPLGPAKVIDSREVREAFGLNGETPSRDPRW